MKIIDIAIKDLLRSFRNLFAIGMMFIAPLLITGLIYFAFGGMSSGQASLPVIKVVLVNNDAPPPNSPQVGQMVAQMMSDSSVSDWLEFSEAPDEDAARQMVNRQEAGVALIIPQDFTNSLLTGAGSPQVLLIHDPTLSIAPTVIKNMVDSLIDGSSGAKIATQTVATRRQVLGLPLDAETQNDILQAYQQWFIDFQRSMYHSPDAALIAQSPAASEQDSEPAAENNSLQSMFGLVLSGQMIFFSFYTGAYSMMSILREEEEGTLARLFTTPTDRTLVLGGKFLSVVLMVLVQALVMVAAGAMLFKVNWGVPAAVALAIIGQAIGATGLGVLLISMVKTSNQAGTVLGGGLTAMGMLGGLFTVAVPDIKVFDLTGLFTPHGWVLRLWKDCLAGAGITQMWLPFLVLTVLGITMFAIGAVLFRRRFA